MNKIRKGDQVIVLTGRDRGKRGVVAGRIDEGRVTVEGVNIVKKHVKPNPMKGTTGGVIEKMMPIHQSNIAIYNAASGKAGALSARPDPSYAQRASSKFIRSACRRSKPAWRCRRWLSMYRRLFTSSCRLWRPAAGWLWARTSSTPLNGSLTATW